MVPSQPLVALPLAILLVYATMPIARRIARDESDPGMFRIVMWGIVLHLVFSPVQIWVVDHYYHGITDYNRYVNQGAILGPRFDRFDFSLANTNVQPLGEGAVSIAAGVVFAIIGVDKLGGFFVFSWLAFIGSVCFYRAFATTFPEGGHKRYARLIFFLPSILFWTSGIAKETIMYLGLGIAAYGASRILTQKRGGALLLALGTGIGVYIRPQELLLFLCAVAMATLFRRQRRRSFGIVRRAVVMGVQLLLIFGALALTNELAKHGAAVFDLSKLAQNNTGQASSIHYSSNPLRYPQDAFYVLLDPLPFNAHSGGEIVAAFENSVVLAIALMSLRRLRHLARVCFLRPYVMACVVYTAVFCYAFAALGNLGLIDRERVLMTPLLLVLFAIPVSPKGSPPTYDWELSFSARRRKRKGAVGPRGESVPPWLAGANRFANG